jgi:hypothetical protein
METHYSLFTDSISRKRAAEFSKKRFKTEFLAAVQAAWNTAGKDPELLAEFSLSLSE